MKDNHKSQDAYTAFASGWSNRGGLKYGGAETTGMRGESGRILQLSAVTGGIIQGGIIQNDSMATNSIEAIPEQFGLITFDRKHLLSEAIPFSGQSPVSVKVPLKMLSVYRGTEGPVILQTEGQPLVSSQDDIQAVSVAVDDNRYQAFFKDDTVRMAAPDTPSYEHMFDAGSLMPKADNMNDFGAEKTPDIPAEKETNSGSAVAENVPELIAPDRDVSAVSVHREAPTDVPVSEKSPFRQDMNTSLSEASETEEKYLIEFYMSDGSIIRVTGEDNDTLSSDFFSGYGYISDIKVIKDGMIVMQASEDFINAINNDLPSHNLTLGQIKELAGIAVSPEENFSYSLQSDGEPLHIDFSLMAEEEMLTKLPHFLTDISDLVVTPEEDFFMVGDIRNEDQSHEALNYLMSVDCELWASEQISHDISLVETHRTDENEDMLFIL